MQRITNQMINNNLTYNLGRQQRAIDEAQSRISTGQSIRVPSDNPIAATNQMIYQSRITEVDQYISNIDESRSRLNEVDSSLQSALKLIQRTRELAIQGANGIFNSFDRRDAMATEIDEMLKEMIAVANTRGAAGRAIFGGYQTGSDNGDPFVPVYQTLESGVQGETITGVEYRGNIGVLKREVDNGEYLDVSIPGNRAFWATNQILTSNKDTGNYVSETNQIIKIDNAEIDISAGDNLDIIIDKINNANISVKASKGIVNNIVLESTNPHQIWLEDEGSGRVLKDLGLINTDFPNPPNNIDPTVTTGGMSVFEVLIQLRDDLIRNDQQNIGGRDIGLIDLGINNFLKDIALTGARENRADEIARRSEYTKENVTQMLAKTEGVDMVEEIMNYRWLESVHNYALAVGAKTITPTLMDFLK